MHDIKAIRENPESFDAALQKRGLAAMAEEILAMDKEERGEKTALQELQQQANELAKQIGSLKAKGENADEAIATSKVVKEKIAACKQHSEGDASTDQSQVAQLLLTLPNHLDDEVPHGVDEKSNKLIRDWGTKKERSFTPKQHFELGEQLGQMDFSQTAKTSGSRFVTLSHQLAQLERALANFMLDIHTTEFGFTEVSPPLLVRDNAMVGSGQLPKFAEDAFCTTNGYWLVPTAEVSLVNMMYDRIVQENELPLRFCAYTPCFRSEAGAAGKDTRGMIRQHQFWKVELVSITSPDQSNIEHEYIVKCAEEILVRLELPYRVMLLCSGDTGFHAKKTFDIEVWLPGQSAYREVSSCSNCGDFQARRMHARYGDSNKQKQIVHTLNGSGLPTGRTLIAILENYQQADGSIIVPEVLRPYMGGLEIIKGC